MSTTTDTLASSLSSLSSDSHHPPSISRSYKQASHLFLTRQLAEAWDVLLPLVTPGSSNEANDESNTQALPRSAPVVSASKSARVKVWSLWIAIMHEVLQLGIEEGSLVMESIQSSDGRAGGRRWRDLSKRIRDGDIWGEIVDTGYAGVESAVDGEVVANLATLLLSHSPTQKVTQARLESYLSASSSIATPNYLISQLKNAQNGDSSNEPNGQSNGHSYAENGTSTPRDLGTRLKLLEIYSLHVLPQNEEWDYARDFISMSEILDEERREAFLAALGGLREESDLHVRRESELKKQRDEEEQRQLKAQQDKARQEEAATKAAEQARRNAEYAKAGAAETFRNSEPSKANGAPKPAHAIGVTGEASASGSRPLKPQHAGPVKSSIKKSTSATSKRDTNAPPPPTFLGRASMTVAALQRAILQMGMNMSKNPFALLRMLFFVVAMVMAFGRQDVRDRVKRGWDKIKGTAGMGVKVSYL